MKKIFAVFVLALSVLISFPLAYSQQPGKVYRIGFLGQGSPLLYSARIKALLQGLREHGYVEGQNLRCEYKYAEGNADRLPSLAAELVRLKVDLLVTTGTLSTRAAKKATSTTPIVMHSGNPVESGLIASLAHPGEKVTGLTVYPGPEIYGKRMELLKEIVPLASRIAILWIPGNTSHRRSWKILQTAAPGLGVTLLSLEIRGSSDIDRAFATMKKERPAGFLILGDALFNTHRKQIVKFSLKSRLPAIYTNVQWVAGGGLMSYGADFVDIYHRMGIYAGKILKGAKAGTLPVEQPRKIDLVINLKTAKHLGLKIPPEILLQATNVIK